MLLPLYIFYGCVGLALLIVALAATFANEPSTRKHRLKVLKTLMHLFGRR